MKAVTCLLFAASCFFPKENFGQAFTPKDTIIGTNFFQVEFSDDMRSMVWCEQIAVGGLAQVWYADVDLELGLPDILQKQLVDTIQGQGWPYWGHDQAGPFFLIKNHRGAIKYIHRTGFNSLTASSLGTVNNDSKSLLNVSSDSTKSYFWINYTVLSPDSAGRDSLFAFRSDNPANKKFIDSEKKNKGGSAYELTFPRWLAQSEMLAYPFRTFPDSPYWDMKFWNGLNATSTQVTNGIATSIFNHHVDDLPFRLPQFPADTFMFSSKAASKLAIYQKNGPFFTQVQLYTSPTLIIPTTLTSFEPFTVNGNQTYGAYQVYSGGGIPGNTPGEIYLKGIFNDPLHVKISDFDGDVAVDPEYVIGNSKVWIFYYGKSIAPGFFKLHRCETPIVVNPANAIDPSFSTAIRLYPNPTADWLSLDETAEVKAVTVRDMVGRAAMEVNGSQSEIDLRQLPTGIYWVEVQTEQGDFQQKIIKK